MSNRGFTNQSGGPVQNVGENILSQTAGIISTKSSAKYTSGARTVLKINNKLVGFAFNISWSERTEVIENKTIDDYLPYELIPNRITVEGTIGAFHIPGQGPTTNYIQPNVLSFLFHKYITIEVRDSATNELLFYTNKAMITSREEDLSAEQLGRMQLRWKAIGWKDELEPKKPTGADDLVTPSENSAGARLIKKGEELLNQAGKIFRK